MKKFLVCGVAALAAGVSMPQSSGAPVAKPGVTWLNELNTALKAYRPKVGGIEIAVIKRTSNPLLLKEKRSEGKLVFGLQRLRLEIAKPEPSLFILSDSLAWLVRESSDGAPPIINRLKSRSLLKSNSAFALIFANEPLGKHFKVIARKTVEKVVEFELRPKDKKATDLVEMQLRFSKNMRQLKQIRVVDERENTTVFELGEPKAIEKLAQDLFTYVPPKGAEVVDL